MSFINRPDGGQYAGRGRRGGGGAIPSRPSTFGGLPGRPGPTGLNSRSLPAAPNLRGVPNATTAPSWGEPAAPVASASRAAGGGGGGGNVPPGNPVMSLEDFIQNHILKRKADAEASRMLDDFDAETMRLKQETEADQAVRNQDLDMYLADAGRDAAGSLAARGLERSGLLFQAQDRINEEGVRRRSSIADLMTQLVGQRGRGRQEAERSARQMINQRIQQLSEMFNEQNMAQVG